MGRVLMLLLRLSSPLLRHAACPEQPFQACLSQVRRRSIVVAMILYMLIIIAIMATGLSRQRLCDDDDDESGMDATGMSACMSTSLLFIGMKDADHMQLSLQSSHTYPSFISSILDSISFPYRAAIVIFWI